MLNHLVTTLVLVVAAATVSLVFSITPTAQINALHSLYNQTNGENWLWRNEQLAGPIWSFSPNQKDPCNTAGAAWQGITCSSIPTRCQTTTCNIVQINLVLYGLEGIIPSDLFTLSSLRSLELDRNQLKGTLPSSIGSLSQLQDFLMAYNQISGTIPSSVGSLSLLQNFYINNNEINGTIPSSVVSLSQLRQFDISNNQITGTIPPSIGSLSVLQYFYIYENRISGTIPTSVGSLSQLQDIVISNNRISGTIPSSIGSLSQLQYFGIDNNYISGTIPTAVGSLSQLQYFLIDNLQINGTIPPSIGSLSQLQYFWIHENQITGTIPSSIGSLSQIQDIGIYNNQISGTIPSSIGSLSLLQNFDIDYNQITGTIPPAVGSLSQLRDIDISNNQISGTLPPSIGSLSQLQYFIIHKNRISGTIPSSIGSLSQLRHFVIYNNQISGPIPSSIGSLSQFEYFEVTNNQISGTIPSSIGSLSLLQYFDIDDNQISGTIPLTFNSLSTLEVLSANSNLLSGTIPLQLVFLSALQQIFLQQNRLTGSLDGFLLDYDPLISQVDLINLDVSGNQLSGTIPSALFLIPSLDSIAMSVNCFEGELPKTICDAVNVSVMSLDGLGASSSCKKQFIIPLTSVSVGRMMKGSIPDCVWKLSALETLHLAGNGLRGRIGGENSANAGTTTRISSPESASNVIPDRNFDSDSDIRSTSVIMSHLVDLTLAHNYLSGEIPNWLLKKKGMRSLDLSHNKLTGDLDDLISKDDRSINRTVTRVLKLEVNRLSGRLPPSMSDYSTLDILSGNLFSCDSIPQNDENSQYYVCGSSEYNQSMMVLGGVIGVLLSLIVFYVSIVLIGLMISGFQSNHHISSSSPASFTSLNSSVRRWCENKKTNFHQMMKYLRYYNHSLHVASSTSSWLRTHFKDANEDYILLSINWFGKSLAGAEKVFVMTTVTIIIFSVPLYVLKDVGEHVTHSHQYQWYFTMSYLSGSVAGLFLMVLCLVCLLVFRCVLWYQSRLLGHTRSVTTTNIMGVSEVESSTSNSRLQELEGNDGINTDSSSISTSSPILHESHLPPCSRQESSFNTTGTRPSRQLQPLGVGDRLYFCLIFVVNIAMVGTVNGLYIWSTVQQLSSSSRILIQLSVSLFGMMWEVFLRSTFPKHLKLRSYSVVWLLSLVKAINGVMIPCVVTALTSPSCYQRLIIEPDDISSSYTYSYCAVWFTGLLDRRCFAYASATIVVSQLIPPFAYSYQCGSTLLTSYIPVKLYSSILAIIVNLVQLILVFQTKVEYYPNFLQESAFLPHRQLDALLVLYSVVSNMILLLSFGLSSPVLCFGICLSLVVSVSCYLIRLGRLIFSSQGNNINHSSINAENEIEDRKTIVELKLRETATGMMTDDPADHNPNSNDNLSPLPGLNSLDLNVNDHDGHKAGKDEKTIKQFFAEMLNITEDGLQCLDRCKWIIMGPSCLFITLLSWDIAGDKVGWEGSYWIPLMGVGIMVTMCLLDYCLKISERRESQSMVAVGEKNQNQ